jgi:hypothetical protein
MAFAKRQLAAQSARRELHAYVRKETHCKEQHGWNFYAKFHVSDDEEQKKATIIGFESVRGS